MKQLNKKGVLGLDTVGAVIVFLLILSVTAIAVFLALNALQNAGLFTTGSANANNTNNVINNVTSGTVNFFTNIPTIMTILGAVVIILAVALILYAVSRFAQTGAGGGGSL